MQPIRFAVFTFGGINLSETQVALAHLVAVRCVCVAVHR